jgi:hypothetical protein
MISVGDAASLFFLDEAGRPLYRDGIGMTKNKPSGRFMKFASC